MGNKFEFHTGPYMTDWMIIDMKKNIWRFMIEDLLGNHLYRNLKGWWMHYF